MNALVLAYGITAVTITGLFQAKPVRAPVQSGSITIASEDFRVGGPIPSKHSAKGGNLSPRLNWTGIPFKTKSIALVVIDPDANGMVHWLIYNLSPELNQLPGALPPSLILNTLGSALQGKNGHGAVGYFGPMPPKGKVHHYHFKLYALNSMLQLKPGAVRTDLERAMSGHVLGSGDLVGTYQTK